MTQVFNPYFYDRYSHRPPHKYSLKSMYMVTAGTLYKQHLFNSPEKLTMLQEKMLETIFENEWAIKAWAIFSNHYHIIIENNDNASLLPELLNAIHRRSATELNRLDNAQGRRVWYNYWDTQLTYQKSYFARLSYVIKNPQKHGIVDSPENYPWCSASWFMQDSNKEFARKIIQYNCDRVNVVDSFDVQVNDEI